MAKADQYRSELEYRQAELRMEQLKKQVRIEVRNAQYALEQTGARVRRRAKPATWRSAPSRSPKRSRTWAPDRAYQTLTAQRDLALAELDLVTAMTIYEKAKVELDRATGTTLEHNGIQLQDAVNGTVVAPNRRNRMPTIAKSELEHRTLNVKERQRTPRVSWPPTTSSTSSKP